MATDTITHRKIRLVVRNRLSRLWPLPAAVGFALKRTTEFGTGLMSDLAAVGPKLRSSDAYSLPSRHFLSAIRIMGM
jgi:hypothetical protein